MRHARNFNPEWGCIAPAPNFLVTARFFVVAVAIGAMASAAAVFSLMDRPIAETSVAARTLVQSVEPTLPARSVPLVAQPQTPSEQTSLSQTGGDAAGAIRRQGAAAHAGAGSPARGARPPIAAALAEAPRIMTTEAPPGGILANEFNIAPASEAAPVAAAAPAPPLRKPRAAARHYEPRYDLMERGPYAFLRQYGSYGREY